VDSDLHNDVSYEWQILVKKQKQVSVKIRQLWQTVKSVHTFMVNFGILEVSEGSLNLQLGSVKVRYIGYKVTRYSVPLWMILEGKQVISTYPVLLPLQPRYYRHAVLHEDIKP